ncbi:MAG: radical SAM protein [Candidatus Helarchaeota archaeon]
MQFTLQLMLTRRCPLRCKYCYVKKEDKDMTEDILNKSIYFGLKKTVEINANYFHLSLTGGEPFLKPKLIYLSITKLREELDRRKIIFQPTIATNGTIFNRKILFLLEKNKENLLDISIDGYREIHNKNRKYPNGKGSYSIVEKNSKKILKIIPWARACTVISKNNFKTINIKKSFENLFKIGFRHMIFGLEYGNYTDDQVKYFHELNKKIIEKASEKIIERNFVTIYPISKFMLHKEIYDKNKSEKLLSSNCGAGKNHFTIDTDGSIYPCTFYLEYLKEKSKLGDVFGGLRKSFDEDTCIFEKKMLNTNLYHRLTEKNLQWFIKTLKEEKIYNEYINWLKKWVR